MKTILLSSLVLFTALFAFNLEAGHGHSRHCHLSGPRVSLNFGATVAPRYAAPVVTTYVPVQPAPVILYQQAPVYTSQPQPVSYVEYRQPVVRRNPWANFSLGFFFGR